MGGPLQQHLVVHQWGVPVCGLAYAKTTLRVEPTRAGIGVIGVQANCVAWPRPGNGPRLNLAVGGRFRSAGGWE